jgi:hypothetical protein
MPSIMTPETARRASAAEADAPVATLPDGSPACPTCGGRMWDNRADKRNPKAPDFKCRDRDCDGRLWPGQFKEAAEPAKGAAQQPTPAPRAERGRTDAAVPAASEPVRERAPAATTLRACYLDVTDFVLAEVRPKYAAAGVPCTDATVAAIVAALFIATCKQVNTQVNTRANIGGGA